MTSISTHDLILSSARTLIVSGGYNGFSYADIATVVGIRKASIHHHFPTKAELVRSLVAGYRKEAEAGLGALEGAVADPADRLRAYVGYWQRCIADASAPFCICALLASEMPALPEEVGAEVRAHFRTLAAWLRTALEQGAGQGRFRLERDAASEAEGFMATIHGAMLSARAYGDAACFDTITDSLLDRLTARP
ncbi:TetR/AcrR family transcriptional regulator [Ancylobacter sp. A5.8]|uniref:TetR/AcrR family transcriptional regulator n=1 Tax=Ancylobacter gelatini TaxID=2919920 RepID=UPI001F4DDB2A|nr:TetR/AcrR family transcriptional regulator [Ancylobacter gelatini]MCJ8144442.1 TetR/AcrR family transcriptional regulator [Ancylobacter gelatini]